MELQSFVEKLKTASIDQIKDMQTSRHHFVENYSFFQEVFQSDIFPDSVLITCQSFVENINSLLEKANIEYKIEVQDIHKFVDTQCYEPEYLSLGSDKPKEYIFIPFEYIYEVLSVKYDFIHDDDNLIELFRIETYFDGFFKAAYKDYFEHKIEQYIDFIKKSNGNPQTIQIGENALEELQNSKEITKRACDILRTCKLLDLPDSPEYTFLLKPDHIIPKPCKDGVLAAIFPLNDYENSLETKEWTFAFNSAEDLLKWIDKTHSKSLIKRLDAFVVKYSVPKSTVVMSENQSIFKKKHVKNTISNVVF
jgi:hypothetical protein